MSGQWKEVVKLAFRGERFRDHAIDLTAIGEMTHFQSMVAETAKTLWRVSNPERERLPMRFEERTRLYIRRIEEGSAVVPLEVRIEEPEQPELLELEPTEVNEAIALLQEVYRAVEMDQVLPERFPRSLVPEYEKWGECLADDEVIQVLTEGKEPARVTATSRSRLAAFREATHEGHIDVTGEVLQADVRQNRFEVWPDDKRGITVSFSPTHEDAVTSALRDHRTVRVQVIGRAKFSALGQPEGITQVDELRVQPVGELEYDTTARPIEDILAELAAQVPQEDWERLPPDLTDNLDHYLYGTPKR